MEATKNEKPVTAEKANEKVEKVEKVEKKNPVKAYNEDYGATYGNLEKAAAALTADLAKAVTDSKENSAKSKTDIDSFHAKDAANVAAADKALAAEEKAAEKATATAKDQFAKETADIKTAHGKALDASKDRVSKAQAAEKKAKDEAEKKKNSKQAVADKANADLKSKDTLAKVNEDKRNKQVEGERAAANQKIKDDNAQKLAELKAAFDKDVADLNTKIENAQKEYFRTVESKNQAFNKSCEDKKAAFNVKMAAFKEKSQSANKVTMKEGMKGLSVTQKEFDKDAKLSKAAHDADLAALKAAFVVSVPPIEHSIFLRTNRYKIDKLAAEHVNIKAVDKSAYEELCEKETNAHNVATNVANNEINLKEQAHVEFCDAQDNKLDIATADFATETFNAEEEFKVAEINFNNALSNKTAEIKHSKAVQDNIHRKNLASIENKYAKLNSKADTDYAHLTSELKSVFASFKSYYATLNKFDGTSVDALSVIEGSFAAACNDLAMADDKAYALFDDIINVYNRDCGKQETGVLDGKVAKINDCEKAALDFAKKRYDYTKSTLKSEYDNEVALENADHLGKIEAFDNELKAFENQTASDIAAANKTMEGKIANINARIADNNNKDKAARADSDKKKNDFIAAQKAKLKKLADEKKARENAKAAKNRDHASELDAKLEALKFAINGEKKGENVMHAKLTEKTKKFLLKGCDIKPGTRWWVVDFSKK